MSTADVPEAPAPEEHPPVEEPRAAAEAPAGELLPSDSPSHGSRLDGRLPGLGRRLGRRSTGLCPRPAFEFRGQARTASGRLGTFTRPYHRGRGRGAARGGPGQGGAGQRRLRGARQARAQAGGILQRGGSSHGGGVHDQGGARARPAARSAGEAPWCTGAPAGRAPCLQAPTAAALESAATVSLEGSLMGARAVCCDCRARVAS